MDLTQLNTEILSALDTDLTAKSYLTDTNDPKYKNWSKDDQGYVCINERIFVPESGLFQLHVLQYHHDHPVSSHFGINKTLALIHRDYVWPNLHSSVTDYCRSCTTCSRSKSKRHKPYGLLRQLPVPVRPWDSISMDFIEQLPTSSDGFTAILVVVDPFTKQSIYSDARHHYLCSTGRALCHPCVLQTWCSVPCDFRSGLRVRISFL